jgi:ribonuclease HII
MKVSRLKLRLRGRIAGVDEAGRGPLAGPVVAAAVILNPARPIRGLADSKALDHEERVRLARLIRERSLCYAVAWADPEEIDSINILQATMLAMRRALLGLAVAPEHVLVDGNRCPCPDGLGFECLYRAVVKGDARVPAISAASILAKTTRDALMCELDTRYPGFALAGHKGYGTPTHVAALNALGPSPLHRRSFSPVRIGREIEELEAMEALEADALEADALAEELGDDCAEDVFEVA